MSSHIVRQDWFLMEQIVVYYRAEVVYAAKMTKGIESYSAPAEMMQGSLRDVGL